jgi:hypothetical protein
VFVPTYLCFVGMLEWFIGGDQLTATGSHALIGPILYLLGVNGFFQIVPCLKVVGKPSSFGFGPWEAFGGKPCRSIWAGSVGSHLLFGRVRSILVGSVLRNPLYVEFHLHRQTDRIKVLVI